MRCQPGIPIIAILLAVGLVLQAASDRPSFAEMPPNASRSLNEIPPTAASAYKSQAQPETSDQKLPKMDAEVLRELVRLRRTQGNFLSNGVWQLGSENQASSADETLQLFEEALTSSAAQVGPPSPSPSSAHGPDSLLPPPQLVGDVEPAASAIQVIQALRRSARELDRHAELLEEAADYPEADRMRKWADQLRRKARYLSSPVSPPASSNPSEVGSSGEPG